MKKKLVAILGVCVLSGSLVLAGCGSSDSSSDSSGEDKQEEEEQAAEDAEEETEVEEAEEEDVDASEAAEEIEESGEDAEEAEAEAASVNADDVDEISLTWTTSVNETETAGELMDYFIDYVSDGSDGKVSIEVYWGGTLADSAESLDFVGTDAADMCLVGQSEHTDTLPLLNFPGMIDGGYAEAMDYMDYMAFENEDTSPLIEAQIEAQNVHMLGCIAAGMNAFCTKDELTTLDELAGVKLGVGMNQSAYEAVGLNVVSMMPWDYYDSLSRGIADCGTMSLSALVSMSIQEVTPYFLIDGTYSAGNFFTINLDVWNGMSEATQTLFEEAMDATQNYAVELAAQEDDDAIAIIEDAGGAVNELDSDDEDALLKAFFDSAVDDCRGYAETAGCQDDMEVVLQASSDYIGYPLE